MFGNFAITKNEQIRAKKKKPRSKNFSRFRSKNVSREKPISENLTSDYKNLYLACFKKYLPEITQSVGNHIGFTQS